MVSALFLQSPRPGLCPGVWQWLLALGGISPQVNHVELSDCLRTCPPSDNFPVASDTNATGCSLC